MLQIIQGKSSKNVYHVKVIIVQIDVGFRLKNCPVIVFGRSLGGAVSFYLAEKYPDLVHGIIVENTFLSISAMVDILMPFLKPLKNLLLTINWKSEEIIANLKQPIYFISGNSTRTLCHQLVLNLFELCDRGF